MNSIRGKYSPTDRVYDVIFPKITQPETKKIFQWIELHCYPNVFDIEGYPTEGPDRDEGTLIFEDDTDALELIQLIKQLDTAITRGAAIPF